MSEIDKNITVLIVDDKKTMRRTIRNMLRQMGFSKFREAEDGDVAINMLKRHTIEFILCDWNMPRLPGIEVLRTVRGDENLRNIPFLMITAEVNEATVAEAGEVDVDGYVVKPFTPELVAEKIQKIWDQKNNPSPLDTHIELGQVYLRAKQYEKAKDEFRQALKVNDKSPRAYHAMGSVYQTMKDYKKAIELYKRSVELAPKFLRAHESLSDVYGQVGDRKMSTFHMEKACQISPRNVDRQIVLGKMLVKIGEEEKAKKVFENVLGQARADYTNVVVQIGEALLAVDLVVEAETAFRQGLESDPGDVVLYNRLGIALRRQGKHDESIKTYRRALSIEPDNESLYYNLSRALYTAGQKDESLEAVKQALKLDPSFTEAQEFLTKIQNGDA